MTVGRTIAGRYTHPAQCHCSYRNDSDGMHS